MSKGLTVLLVVVAVLGVSGSAFAAVPNPVPEPISSTLFLLGAGAFGLKMVRRKKA